MKKRPLFFGFINLFLIIPFCCGIALTFFLQLDRAAFPNSAIATALQTFPQALRAGVYPEPDEIPDGNIPQGTIEKDFLPTFINILLALISTIDLGAMLFSGTMFVIHFGDEEKLKMAKGILKLSVVGLIIILVAYAIVQGVTQLTFNTP